jgi:hypothetical protein
MVHKILHTKLKIEQHNPHLELAVKSGAAETDVVCAPLVAPIHLLLKVFLFFWCFFFKLDSI